MHCKSIDYKAFLFLGVHFGVLLKVGFIKYITLAEKVLYAHTHEVAARAYGRGHDYVNFAPDHVAMQDATAQIALLQFSTCGRDQAAVPSTVHCYHLIQAKGGAEQNLATVLANDLPSLANEILSPFL